MMIPTEYGDVVYEKWLELEIPRRKKGNKHKFEIRYKGNMGALFIVS